MSGSLHVGTCSRTPTPTPSPASSACAASRSSTRWGGTTTGCPPSAGCRTTTACAATRRCPTTPTSCRPTKPGEAGDPDQSRQNFVELCDRLVVEDEQKFEELWRTLGLSVDWSMTYTTIGERAQPVVAAGVPAQSRPRRGVPGGGAHALGRRLPHGGRRRPSSKTASCPGAYHAVQLRAAPTAPATS